MYYFTGNYRSSWAIDNVFVGVANMLSNDFYEDFESYEYESTQLINNNLYRLKGAIITVTSDCEGTKNKVKGQSSVLKCK